MSFQKTALAKLFVVAVIVPFLAVVAQEAPFEEIFVTLFSKFLVEKQVARDQRA